MITITLVGRLTKDAKLKYTDQGKPVANFTIACTRKRVDKDGNKQTSFVRCVLWGKPAEVLSKYCQKGALIGAQGELVTRHYDNQQGVTQYVTEVWLDSFEFLESKHARDQRETTLATKEDSQESHVPAEASKTTQTGSESLSDLEPYNQPPIDGMTTYGAETTSLFDKLGEDAHDNRKRKQTAPRHPDTYTTSRPCSIGEKIPSKSSDNPTSSL